MIKALFIAFALAASGGAGIVYAQAATPAPTQSSSGDAAASPAAPAGNAAATRSSESKKSNNVEVKREELGQKLLKRKMELDNNDRPNIQPAQAPDRAREKQVAPADNKGQKK